MRGEDAFGVLVAQRVDGYPAMAVEPRSLLEALEELDDAIIVDAAAGRPHGALEEWDVDDALGYIRFGPNSSHALGLADALRLARILHRLPPYLKVLTIGIAQTDLGSPCTPEVLRSVDAAAQRAETLLRNAG